MKTPLEEALKIADSCRALTKPEKWQDYGAGIDLRIELLPHMAVLAQEVKRLNEKIKAAETVINAADRLLSKLGTHEHPASNWYSVELGNADAAIAQYKDTYGTEKASCPHGWTGKCLSSETCKGWYPYMKQGER